MRTISIADDFTKYPGGRYRKHGKGSGEEFRDDYLVPAIKNEEQLIIVLDGTAGYSSSFLEEAFGGLIRRGFQREKLRQLLRFKAEGAFKTYENMIWKFVDATKPEAVAH
ncbi:STAS-like domain-containing protein [Shinella zoogloeoides]|uniref:STAS-like domain-containing protein n=1 Tax=Shinella zoogloeoides TaxID=352475 RepID=UPI000E64EF28|nr:STAS-like domain-containing protein [Shinella zoogloeoides]